MSLGQYYISAVVTSVCDDPSCRQPCRLYIICEYIMPWTKKKFSDTAFSIVDLTVWNALLGP